MYPRYHSNCADTAPLYGSISLMKFKPFALTRNHGMLLPLNGSDLRLGSDTNSFSVCRTSTAAGSLIDSLLSVPSSSLPLKMLEACCVSDKPTQRDKRTTPANVCAAFFVIAFVLRLLSLLQNYIIVQKLCQSANLIIFAIPRRHISVEKGIPLKDIRRLSAHRFYLFLAIWHCPRERA